MNSPSACNHIGLLTSGGDVPGLNACIRSILSTAGRHGIRVTGFRNGYDGLISNETLDLSTVNMRELLPGGGTVLHSSRSERFRKEEGLKEAARTLKNLAIDGLIVLGGDGSLQGASLLAAHSGIKVIGIPKTIDNDITGTDYCLGFDTALNTAVEAIDRLRDTAESHQRIFVVEVMGRKSGALAFHAALAAGAEAVLLPELSDDNIYLEDLLKKRKVHSKGSMIIVVAEGDESGGGEQVKEMISGHLPGEYVGLAVLGHIQRGGRPSAFDRIVAARMGFTAVEELVRGGSNLLAGWKGGGISLSSLKDVKRHQLHVSQTDRKLLAALFF